MVEAGPVSAIILAAGLSSRMGSFKPLYHLGGKFVKISGTDDKCYKSYYVIPGPNGTAAIIAL